MSNRSTDDEFYEKATQVIMDWLSESDKIAVALEIRSDDTTLEDFPPRLKLMFLLNYLETNFVKSPEVIDKVQKEFETLRPRLKSKVDFGVLWPDQETLPLSSLSKKIPSGTTAPALMERFRARLQAADILQEYDSYVKSLQEYKREERRERFG